MAHDALTTVHVQRTNHAVSKSPPSPTMLLKCLEDLVAVMGGEYASARLHGGSSMMAKDESSTSASQLPPTGPPMQPQVTAAGVKIFPNAGFNMDDYTTKLDKSALTEDQIRMAERLAKEIER
eukprot:COSAG01_NODE_21049_length_920_cov_69.127893_2_plen_122_part_01